MRRPWRWIFLGLVLVVAVALAVIDLRPDLSHVDLVVLSGPRQGHYHAFVERLGDRAAGRNGHLTNQESPGSVANLEKLLDASEGCDVQFALVQAGLTLPVGAGEKLELLGRLAKAESVFFLGREADHITSFGQLAGLQIGIGPEGGGTGEVARRLFEAEWFRALRVDLVHYPIDEQLRRLESGELPLGMWVIDEDAALIEDAVAKRGLQIASFDHADVIARKLPFARVGRIGAGQYDPLRVLPPTDKRVLRVDTLVLGNRCASRSEAVGLLTLLQAELPDFIRHNRETPNATGIRLSSTAQGFFDAQGPEVVDDYVPWLVDLVPPSNWVYLIMAVSVLFNLMGIINRFRLWRLDTGRVMAERQLAAIFGPGRTHEDVLRMPADEAFPNERRTRLSAGIKVFEELAERARKQSLSIFVPMGQEMSYRYQEQLIEEWLAVLRSFEARLPST